VDQSGRDRGRGRRAARGLARRRHRPVRPKWGERPILLVETQAEVSDEALLASLRGRVAPWWIPDAVFRLPRMPLAATGKIDKIRLRSEYGGE
jgi:acyl-CoA synthetase (AMP-forming)/AMP-acid ligase II